MSGADVVVYASVAFLGFYAARALGTPGIMAEMQPVFEPTGDFPSAVAPEGPRWCRDPYNRLSYAVVRQVYWRTFRSMFEGIEDRMSNLGRIPRLRGPWGILKRSGLPVLCGWSSRVLPRPSEWSGRFRVTGYWFLDQHGSWSPPAGLEDFLRDTRSPAVAISFSSVRAAGEDVHRVSERASEAAAANGMKVVFVGGWSGVSGRDLPSSAFVLDDVPHDWLFSRVRGVIHHGGAGTTAAALRAGAPSVVLPFSADQAFWGRTVERVGAGVLCASHRGASSNLTRALATVTTEGFRRRTAAISSELRGERGAVVASDVIERSMIDRSVGS